MTPPDLSHFYLPHKTAIKAFYIMTAMFLSQLANARLDMSIDLLAVLNEYTDVSADTIITICEASKLLLNDTKLLLTAFKSK